MFNPLPNPNDPPQHKPISARRCNPVAVNYCDLPHGALWTFTTQPYEVEKVRGHEQEDERVLAEDQGSVIIWLTTVEWDRLEAFRLHRTGAEQAHGVAA